MTPQEFYALTKLSEESGEIVQIKAKIDLWGLLSYSPIDETKTTNRGLLQHELGDILACIDYAIEIGLVDPRPILDQRTYKLAILRKEGGDR